MTDLTYRAERAVLGALLAGGAENGVPDGIAAADFGDRRHKAIFAALTDGVPEPVGLLGRLRAWLTGLGFRGQVAEFWDYLAGLPDSCPDPRHLSSYADMVAEAGETRRLAAGAERGIPELGRLAGAAAYLARETEKAAASPRWPARGVPAAADAALARDTVHAARAVRQSRPGQIARPAQEHPSQRPPVTREDLEELVLADLLQRPGSAEEIFGWLPARVFTSEARRVIYGSIRHRVQEGEPADPLIIAWEIGRARELRRDDPGPDGQALDPESVLRIGAMDVAPGTAALLGRALLADHLYTRRHGPDWPQSVPATRPDSTPAPEPGIDVPSPQPQPGVLPEAHIAASPRGPAEQPPPAAEQVAVMEPPPAVPAPAGPVQRM